jgi:hypothetical protein
MLEGSAGRERMVVLCARALRAELSFDELVAEFPDGAPDDEYLAIAYEDLVDAVEHLPATFFGKTDLPAWRNSEMFATLTLHLLLLDGRENTQTLSRLYQYVRRHDLISVEALPQLVSEARRVI